MKSKGWIIALITFLSGLAIALVVLMIVLLNGGFKNLNFIMFASISKNVAVDEVYEENFRMIEIDADASEIEFYSTEEDKVRLVIHGEEKDISVTTRGERLSITSNMQCNFICFNQNRSKIEVYLPKDYEGKIKVENDYGNVTIGSFENAEITVENDCGDIKVEAGNIVKLENDLGDIELGFASNAEIKQNCGKIEVGEVGDIKAENDLGDIKIEKVTNSLQIKDDCGDIVIDDITITKNSSITNDLGKIKIGFTNDIYIDAETDLGKVKINENTRDASITLKLQNSCGDIIVDN